MTRHNICLVCGNEINKRFAVLASDNRTLLCSDDCACEWDERQSRKVRKHFNQDPYADFDQSYAGY